MVHPENFAEGAINMTETQFRDLCRNASLALQAPSADALGEYGQIEVDGVDIGLFFDEEETPDMMFCYVDLGEVADTNRADIYENLLTLNLLSGSKTTGVYALDPASGNAIFVVHFYDPEEMEGNVLAEALRFYATQANSMRATLLKKSGSDARFAVTGSEAGVSMVDLA
jgi:hypothetical protein